MIPETYRECRCRNYDDFVSLWTVCFPQARQNFLDFNLIVFPLAAIKMVILVLALRASDDQGDSFSHYAMTSVTTPAPTVWPPSRIANRTPFSIAIGVISSTSNSTLSPGITISTPGFSVTFPVTSLVRK